MTEHFHLWALLIAQGNIYPIPAYQKATELLAAYNKELNHEEEEQARLQAAVAGAIAAGGEAGKGGDAAKLVAAAASDSK